LAVMSIETFERLAGKLELYKLIDEGLEDVKNNRVLSVDDAFRKIRCSIIDKKMPDSNL